MASDWTRTGSGTRKALGLWRGWRAWIYLCWKQYGRSGGNWTQMAVAMWGLERPPTQGTLQIAAPDQSIKSEVAIRQSNRVEYGFDFALDPYVNGMGYLYGTSGNGRTALEQFDRINNFVGVGITAPQAKFQVSDMAKVYNTVNNEYDSNVEIQGLFSGRAIGQGPSFGFVDLSTGRGAASATIR